MNKSSYNDFIKRFLTRAGPHPDPERIRTVMNSLQYAYLNQPFCHVDFSAKDVTTTHSCGTVACHGGWLAIALGVKPPSPAAKDLLYFWGARAFSQYVFNNPNGRARDLWEWAKTYPDLWGNGYGYHMFSYDGFRAFGKRERGECSVPDIIAHWRAVANRIEETNHVKSIN